MSYCFTPTPIIASLLWMLALERTRAALGELMSRRLDDVRPAVMMIDGIGLGERTNVVALGITTEGVKIPLGLWEGSTENATVATALLSDLGERGLDPERGILFVIDGAKAVRRAIRTVFGDQPVQRRVRHKERNVIDHALAERAGRTGIRSLELAGERSQLVERTVVVAKRPGAAQPLSDARREGAGSLAQSNSRVAAEV
jgi:hypothetical protein